MGRYWSQQYFFFFFFCPFSFPASNSGAWQSTLKLGSPETVTTTTTTTKKNHFYYSFSNNLK
jgi:hypothetical protein